MELGHIVTLGVSAFGFWGMFIQTKKQSEDNKEQLKEIKTEIKNDIKDIHRRIDGFSDKYVHKDMCDIIHNKKGGSNA